MMTTQIQSTPTISREATFSGIFRDRTFWLITGVALVVRLAYWWLISAQSPLEALLSGPPDTLLYIELANGFTRFTVANEMSLYLTGFGYSAFLAALLLLSAKSYYFALTVQVVLSSLSAGLLYHIGKLITGHRTVGIIAGLINATSLTAVALSVMFLTETLFFFVLCVSVMLFFKLIENPQLKPALALGILVGYAVFIRSAGQFLPLALFFAALVIPSGALKVARSKLLLMTGVSSAVALLLIGSWMMRNYAVHGTAVVAGTGLTAAGTYLGARIVADKSNGVHLYTVRDNFEKELRAANPDGVTPRIENEFYASKLKKLFSNDPYTFFATFLRLAKENMLAADGMTEFLMHQNYAEIHRLVRLPAKLYLNYLPLLAVVIGLYLLIHTGRVAEGALLGTLYVYFILISGFTFWEGSRICYPAQLSWSLFFGVAVFYLSRGLSAWVHESKVSPYYLRLTSGLNIALLFPNRLLHLPIRTYRRSVAALVMTVIVGALWLNIWSATRPPTFSEVGFPAGQTFSGAVEVTAIRLEEKNGSTVAIHFDFNTLKTIESNYRFYLHLFSVGGSDRFNRDFAPSLATSLWEVGAGRSERRYLELPPGEYNATLGMFNSAERFGQPLSFRILVK